MPRGPLNAVQLQVLRAIAEGGALTDNEKVSARALESRRLVVVTRRGGTWIAQVTHDGEHYLRHGRYPDPPPEADPPSMPKSRVTTATDRVVARQARRLARTTEGAPRTPRSSSPPIPSPSRTRLEPMNMRYRIVISRVQTAERHVRAATEEEALVNRPGSDGGSQSMKDESHGSTEEVRRRAA